MKQIAIKTRHSHIKNKQVAIPWGIIIIIASICSSLAVGGCAWFGGNTQSDADIRVISSPPQKLNESDTAMPIIPPTNASGAIKEPSSPPREERIQEDRENGVVNEIKVNNKHLPSYYIYPTEQQNYDYNRIPDSNVTTPNWQISW